MSDFCGYYRNAMCVWGGDGADAVCGFDVPERNRTAEMKATPCQRERMENRLQAAEQERTDALAAKADHDRKAALEDGP